MKLALKLVRTVVLIQFLNHFLKFNFFAGEMFDFHIARCWKQHDVSYLYLTFIWNMGLN